jgi:hypothetical protein
VPTFKHTNGAKCVVTTSHFRDGRSGVRIPTGVRKRVFSSPNCPDQLWGTLSLLLNGYRFLLGVKEAGS